MRTEGFQKGVEISVYGKRSKIRPVKRPEIITRPNRQSLMLSSDDEDVMARW
jgi:hypothetical protein